MNGEVHVLSKRELFGYLDELFHPRNIKLYGEDNICDSIGQVLTGNAHAISAHNNGKFYGVAIFRVTGHDRRVFEFMQLYAKNSIRDGVDIMLDWAKAQGFRALCGVTKANGEALSKILGAKIVSTYLEKEL